MELYYVNKKRKKVEVFLTNHAIEAFRDRWKKVYPEDHLEESNLRAKLVSRFKSSHRVKNLSKQEKERIRKHGPTLFFRQNSFTFVVADCRIVTVEISDKYKRYLNKDERAIQSRRNILGKQVR